jgi:hypothetical protein
VNIDIRSTVIVIAIMAAIGAVILLSRARNAIQLGKKLTFFYKKRDQYDFAFTLFLGAILLAFIAFASLQWGECLVYQYFPPTLTPSLSPTITQTPTITLTPTETLTPTITNTPSVTNTPSLPGEIVDEFEAVVTPSEGYIFSTIKLSSRIDDDLQPINPAIEFENPLKVIYATYSYNLMSNGIQWTEVWLRDGEIIQYNVGRWQGQSGGYGAASLELPADEWLPGNYQVQFFIGTDWLMSGHFRVLGLAPTATPTITPTFTLTPSPTPTRTNTPLPTATLLPSANPQP